MNMLNRFKSTASRGAVWAGVAAVLSVGVQVATDVERRRRSRQRRDGVASGRRNFVNTD